MSLLYTDEIFLSVYSRMNYAVNLIPSVTAFVKTYTSLHCLTFFILSILIAIPLIYTNDVFLSMVANWFNNEKIWSVFPLTIDNKQVISKSLRPQLFFMAFVWKFTKINTMIHTHTHITTFYNWHYYICLVAIMVYHYKHWIWRFLLKKQMPLCLMSVKLI